MLELTEKNFEEEVIKSDKKVLVDFYATWCGPCQMIAPIIDEIAKEHTELKVGRVNVDENQALAMNYKIVSIPFLILFKDGKIEKKLLGYHDKKEILDMILLQ